jgi:hypothetical protein
MDPGEFFYRLNSLMRANPPATVDGGALRRFARIGVGPGKGFDVQARPLSFARELERGVHAGMARILEHVRRPKAKTVNGWQLLTDAGRYGTDYAWRAAVAHVRLGANLPEDAVYPHAWVDATGRPLSGAYRYRIHFRASAFPPVHAFWSITLYDDQQALVPNPIGRYALGDRDRLTFAPDGSLTLFVQNEPPDRGKQPNWLPAPRGGFNLFMRLYWPMAEVLDGTWRPPAVERLE